MTLPYSITGLTSGTYTTTFLSAGCSSNILNDVVAPAIGTSLPLVEGFDSGVFPPVGWTNLNPGGGHFWGQSNQGTAPTPGNSMMFSNQHDNRSFPADEMRTMVLDFSTATAARLTFDVAYRRYDVTFWDGLEVLVSTDCGATFTSLFFKESSALATEPDNTGSYISPAVWRNELVDLSAYDGQSSVIVSFKNHAGYGSQLYVDNINIDNCTNPEIPTLTYNPTSICDGDSTVLNISGNLNDAAGWSVYENSCGGTLVGTTSTSSISVLPSSPNTTYYVRGEGGCATPSSCASVDVIASPNPVITLGTETGPTTCGGADGEIIVSGSGSGSGTVSWTGTSSGNSGNVTLPYTISGLIQGSYNIVFNDGCPSNVLNSTLSDPATPSAPMVTVVDNCGSSTLTATGTNLLWSTTETASNITVGTAGTYTVTQTVAGCTSLSSSGVASPLLAISSTTVITACDNILWNGTTFNTTGIYNVTLTNAVGCDSIASLDLTIINSTTSTDTKVACDSYTWIDGNTYTASNNTATHTLTNAAGCDSVVTLNLTINSSNTGIDTQVACDSYTWIDGNTYTTSNNSATHTLTNAAGCDSVVTLNLTINSSNTGIDTQVACDSYTWIDGNTYTTSNNSATHTLTNAAGCDSVVTLNLTINNSNTGVDTQIACDSYTWIDGVTYIISNNTATQTLTNAAGCDSIVTLNLTINNSNTGVDTQIACDSYTWIDGNTYTASNNTATQTLTNAAGCDSVVTLNLTINNSNTGVDTQVACDSYTWIDGVTYTTSNNTATQTLTNAAGCDSTVTLNLTINNSTTGVDTQVACDSYTWIDGNTYTSSNNTATQVLTNTAGCDSIVTLDLTINISPQDYTQSIHSCGPYTWIDGITYTSSNDTAIYNGISQEGCSYIITLNLVVGQPSSSIDIVNACDSYTWVDGITYTASNNIATHVIPNATGCDSTITIDLTIPVLDISVTDNSPTLTVNASGVTYQWIDCTNGNTPIAGETSQSFTASSNGDYAVIVNDGTCEDTSACITVSNVGIHTIEKSEIEIYPNPASNILSIDFNKSFSGEVRLITIDGKIVLSKVINNLTQTELLIDDLATGMYSVQIIDKSGGTTKKIIKQ